MYLIRRRYKRRTGDRRTVSRWYVCVKDTDGAWHRIPAFADKRTSGELGRKIELLVACRAAGERPTGELAKWVETLSQDMARRLVSLGMLEGTQAAAGKPLTEHLADYEAAMLAKSGSERHVKQEKAKIQRILDGCGFTFWSDISASRFESYLADRRNGGKGIGPRTSNSYLVAFKAFCNWMVRDGRAVLHPVHHLRRVNERADVRRKRRVLPREHLSRLIQAAYTGEDVKGMPGPQRAMLYRLTMETGFRWRELRSLTRASFDLDADPPTVTVAAGYTKGKRETVQPIRREAARILKAYFAEQPALPHAKAFPDMPSGRVGWLLIKADLAKATADGEADGLEPIPYEDAAGRKADFHALRHSFLTHLERAGVSPRDLQLLGRHRDFRTTERYLHMRKVERAASLEGLPEIAEPSDRQATRATGTNDVALAHPRSHGRRFSGSKRDYVRRDDGRREERKAPANTGESLHPQGLSDGDPEGTRTLNIQIDSLAL